MKNAKFDKPLNEWITETMPVEKIDYDPETNTASRVTTYEKLRVKYIDVPKRKYRCKEGTHIFRVISKSKYLFACKNCQFTRQVYPGIYRLTEDGHLQHIASGRCV